MEIIPAIDLRGGRCVRLVQGDYARETVYDGDPVEYACRWASEGARRLHVVDLDGAREGQPRPENLTVLAAIVRSAGVPVQMGGGVRTLEMARRVLDLGVERVIVGSTIVGNDALAASFFQSLGERVIAGVDARPSKVAVYGWQETTGEDAVSFAVRMRTLGARRIIFTDIGRDGTESGPNTVALRRLAEAVSIPVIASGGIGSLEDIVRLVQEAPPNVEGVIVGRAIYSGSVRLAQAIAATEALGSDRSVEAHVSHSHSES